MKIKYIACIVVLLFSCNGKTIENNIVLKEKDENIQFSNSSKLIGKEVFDNMKIINSNSDKIIKYYMDTFMNKEEGREISRRLIWKAPQYGVFDWSKIEYIDYKYKYYQKSIENYSEGLLVVKLNGVADFNFLAINILCIQTNTGYKIIEYNEDWLIDLEDNYFQAFSQENNVKMINSIEYYKNEIINYQDNYYGFKNISMEITQMMNISLIIKIDNLIPNLLTFFVCWYNQKGYVYYLYGFNNEQKIAKHYYCGDFVSFDNYKRLTEKLYGNILEYGAISVGDFNNNGKNEIALYSFYKNIGNVFCVYGFSDIENDMVELCLVPVFINYDNPFPSVEYIENGFKIIEVIDEEFMELSWIKYIWENDIQKYIKQ